MNKIKSIIMCLYANWFVLALGLVSLEVWGFGITSAWSFVWPCVLLCIMVMISVQPPLKNLRFITWPMVKRYYEGKFKQSGPLLAYPMMIWCVLEGEKIYMEGGDLAFRNGIHDRIKSMQGLTDILKKI